MFAYLAVQIKSIFTAASLIKVHTLIAMQTCIRYLINHNLAIFIIVSELQKVHYCNYKQSLVSSFFSLRTTSRTASGPLPWRFVSVIEAFIHKRKSTILLAGYLILHEYSLGDSLVDSFKEFWFLEKHCFKGQR